MGSLNVREIVNGSSTNLDGDALFSVLEQEYKQQGQILLVIDNDLAMSSSFLNSSIGAFLDKYGLEVFKKSIRFKGNQNQFNRLSRYIQKYTEAHLKA